MPNRVLVQLEKLFPVLCLLACCILFTPFFHVQMDLHYTLFIHLVSYLTLGIFFEIPEMGLNLWSVKLSSSEELVSAGLPLIKRIFNMRYVLTHFIAPCSGIMTVMSGLALVHLGNYSFTTGWLFWILVAAIFGLYKGMNQHNYYMKQMCLYIKRSPLDRKNLARMIRSVFDQSLIILEFPTYVFIYAVAYYKPRWPAPFESTVGHVEELFHAPALFGLFLVGVGGLLIPVFRSLIKKYSCVARLTRKGDI